MSAGREQEEKGKKVVSVEDDFESDEETPVFADGTRLELREQTEAARRMATEPGVPDEDVASLVHDLKNPLAIIMLEAAQIEQRLGARTTPALLRGLERITQNAAYVDRLVSNLLDVASADAGRLELHLERVDLARLLRDCVERCVATPDRTRTRLEVRQVLFIEGDDMRIERVVSNLLTNAFKYSPEGFVTLRLEQREECARVSVIDSGPGLTQDQTQRVFERYRRQTSGMQHGYGLGLYSSRKIIEAHRGYIGVASTPGRGARFYFELPLVGSDK
jgi:signal transduction histidine kinase